MVLHHLHTDTGTDGLEQRERQKADQGGDIGHHPAAMATVPHQAAELLIELQHDGGEQSGTDPAKGVGHS
ncbi:MAG: hypothetical protein ACK55I_50695, partial [bacterium]